MTVIRVNRKSTRIQKAENSGSSEILLREDAKSSELHLNLKELNGIEFDQDHKPRTWANRKQKLFSGTKDF